MERYLILCIILVFGADALSVEKRLGELERVVKLQTETIAKHESVIQDQMVTNDRIKEENNKLKTRVEILEVYIKKMNAKSENNAETPNDHLAINSLPKGIERRPKEKLKKGPGEIRHAKYSSNFSARSIDARQNYVGKRQVTNIAFFAYLSSKKCFGDYDIVVFDVEGLDYGDGYTTYDGIYTVPAAGTYVFTWTITSHYDDWFISDLVVDGIVRSWTMSTTDNDPGTGMIIVDVNEGSHVFIRRARGEGCTIPESHARSSFSGWKLF